MNQAPATGGPLGVNPFRSQKVPIVIDLTAEDEPTSRNRPQNQDHPISDDHLRRKLQQYFGYTRFQDKLQWLAIREVVKRKHDVYISMPIGIGRSLCYQLPALLHADRITVVLCPRLLNALDHIAHLRQLHICAESIDEEMSIVELDRVLSDLCSPSPLTRLLYLTVSHAVDSQSCCRMLQSLQRRQRLAQFVVEQADCASKWSHAYRPDYLLLGRLHAMFASVPWIVLTDSAVPQHVEAGIVKQLRLQRPVRWFKERPLVRHNLFYDVVFKVTITDRLEHLREYVVTCLGRAIDWHGTSNPCGIIYCRNSASVDQIAASLSQLGIPARSYHAQLDDLQLWRTRIDWLDGRFPVICTTISEGIEAARHSIRFVAHWNLPRSLNEYYRQTSAAGLDGQLSFCRIFYGRQEQPFAADGDAESEDRALLDFQQMQTYCETLACRQRRISEYFGYWPAQCLRMCDVCAAPRAAEAALVAFQLMEREAWATERQHSAARNGRVLDADCDDIDSQIESSRERDSNHSSLAKSSRTTRSNSREHDFDDLVNISPINTNRLKSTISVVSKRLPFKPLRRRQGRPRHARLPLSSGSDRSVPSHCDRVRSRSPLSDRERGIETVNLISSSESDKRSPKKQRTMTTVTTVDSSDLEIRSRRRDRQQRVPSNRHRSRSCSMDTVKPDRHWLQHCDRQRSRSPVGDDDHSPVDDGDGLSIEPCSVINVEQAAASDASPGSTILISPQDICGEPNEAERICHLQERAATSSRQLDQLLIASAQSAPLPPDDDDQEMAYAPVDRPLEAQAPQPLCEDNVSRSLAKRIEAEQQRIEICVMSCLQPYHNANRIVPAYLVPLMVQRIAGRFQRCDSRAKDIEAYVDRIFVRLPYVRTIRDIDESEFL